MHQLIITGGSLLSLRAEAQAMASAAATLLELSTPPLDLVHAVEETGARVLRLPLSDELLGAFIYAGETAPGFLLNRRLTPGGGRIALARLYAHYLVDNDPWQPEMCRPELSDDDEHEMRAVFFAEELLAPEDLVAAMREQGATVEVIATALELPVLFVTERLMGLGEDVPPVGAADWWGEDPGDELPERMVHLALEGIHSDRIDVTDLAESLGVDRTRAIGLLRLSSATPSDASEGPRPDPRVRRPDRLTE